MTYRGHTAESLTGVAADEYQLLRQFGLTEAAALRNVVDAMPGDEADQVECVMEAFGLPRSDQPRQHLQEAGPATSGTTRMDAEWRQIHEAARRAEVLPAGADPWTHEPTREFARRVAAAEGRGLPLQEAIAAARQPAPPTTAPPNAAEPTVLSEADRQRLVADNDEAVRGLIGLFSAGPHDPEDEA